jgi:hypothetical protein
MTGSSPRQTAYLAIMWVVLDDEQYEKYLQLPNCEGSPHQTTKHIERDSMLVQRMP